MNILFVCTGNTCRSPMAEAILRHKLETINVQSAGIFANENERANPLTLKVLQKRNIHLDHYSQPVTDKLLNWAHYVLTMTRSHKEQLQRQYPEYKSKYFTLKQFINDNSEQLDVLEGSSSVIHQLQKFDVIDPFGGTIETYEETFHELDCLINRLIEKIKDKGGE